MSADDDPDDEKVDSDWYSDGKAKDDVVLMLSGKTTLTVTDHSAELTNNAPDAAGFRVLIASPGEWRVGGD